MFNLSGVLGTLANLAVIVVVFGAIILIHVLGHFLATKWACPYRLLHPVV